MLFPGVYQPIAMSGSGNEEQLDPESFDSTVSKHYAKFGNAYDSGTRTAVTLNNTLVDLYEVYEQMAQLATNYDTPSDRLKSRYRERRDEAEDAHTEFSKHVNTMEEALSGLPDDEELKQDISTALEDLSEYESVSREYLDTFDTVIDTSGDALTVDSEAVHSAEADFNVLNTDANEFFQKVEQHKHSDLWTRVGERVGESEYEAKDLQGKIVANVKAFSVNYASELKKDLKVPSWKYKVYTVIQHGAFWIAILSLLAMDWGCLVGFVILWLVLVFLKGSELSKLNQQGYAHPNQ